MAVSFAAAVILSRTPATVGRASAMLACGGGCWWVRFDVAAPASEMEEKMFPKSNRRRAPKDCEDLYGNRVDLDEEEESEDTEDDEQSGEEENDE
jgi:hypothetical protein